METLRFKPSGLWRLDDTTPFTDYSGYSRSSTLSGSEKKGIPLTADSTYSQVLDSATTITTASPVYAAGTEKQPFSLSAVVCPAPETEGYEAQTYRENLAPNPSFEVDTSGWNNNGSGTIVESSTTKAFVGTRSMRVVPGMENWGYLNPITAGYVQTGKTYTYSIWVNSTVTQDLRLINYAPGGSYPSGTVCAAGVWTKLTLTQLHPVDTPNVYLSVRRTDNTTATEFYADAFMIEESATANPYFDGTVTGYEWSGTAHNSRSRSLTNVSRINYAINPDGGVSTGVGGIGSGTATVSSDATVSYSGGSSVKWSITGNSSLGGKFMIPASHRFYEGQVVYWKLRVRASKSGMTLNPYWERSSPYTGGQGDITNSVTSVADTWHTITGRLTISAAQAQGTNFGFGFYLGGGPTWVAGDAFWIDEGQIEVSSLNPTYFSGATNGAGWSGTTNSSPSYMYTSGSDQQVLSNQNLYDGLTINGSTVSFSTRYTNTGEAKCSYGLGEIRRVDIVGVHSQTKNSLYVDGELVSEVDISADQQLDSYAAPNANLYSGLTAGSQAMSVNNLGIFSRLLQPEEIRAMYTANKRVAEGVVPRMYGGEDLPLGASVRPGYLFADWNEDIDWSTATLVNCASDDDQLVAEKLNGTTMAGYWIDTLDIYNGATATPIRSIALRWKGKNVTVSTSLDGETWTQASNGQTISTVPAGTDPTNKALYIKATFAAGNTEAYLDYLEVRGHISDTAISKNRTITYPTSAVVYEEKQPILLSQDWGVRLYGGTLTISTDTISTTPDAIRTVEIWMRSMDNLSTNLGAGTIYSNGVTGFGLLPGVWQIRTYVLNADHTGNITITGSGQIGKVAVYPTALSASDVAEITYNYTGIAKYSQNDGSAIALSEPVSSTSVYDHDWEIVAS